MSLLDKYVKEYQKSHNAGQNNQPDDFVDKVACAYDTEIKKDNFDKKKTLLKSIPIAHACYNVYKLRPGGCDSCPACGFWDYKGPGKFCFHQAYFIGKPGQPKPITTAKDNCPLENESDNI